MTSRERVRAAIGRGKVDKVPLGFYAVDCDKHDLMYVHDPTRRRTALERGAPPLSVT